LQKETAAWQRGIDRQFQADDAGIKPKSVHPEIMA